MARKSNEEKALGVVHNWQGYQNPPIRTLWETRASRSRGAYYSAQWSQEDLDDMTDRGFWPVVKNRLAPPAKKMIDELSTRSPAGKVIAVQGGGVNDSVIMNGIIKHIEYMSKRQIQMKRVAKDMITNGGIGWAMPVVDRLSSDGQGDILVRRIDNRNVYSSPTVTDIPNLLDAPSIIIAKDEPLAYAKQMNPKISDAKWDEVRNYDSNPKEDDNKNSDDEKVDTGVQTNQGQGENGNYDTVFKVEEYKLETRRRWQVNNKYTGQSYITYDQNLGILEKIVEFTGLIEKIELPPVRRCKVTHCYAPNLFVSEEWLELDRYPMVPFVYEDTENLFPVDAIYFAFDEQLLLNKRESMAILYTQLAMTPKLIIDKEMYQGDKEEIKKNWASVNAVLELQDAFSEVDGKPHFQVVQPSGVPNQFIPEAMRSEAGINTAMGVHPMEMGDPSDAPRTYAATLSIREWGKSSRRGMLDMYNISMELLYDNIVALIPTVYKDQRVLNYLDDDFIPQEVKLNIPEYVDGFLKNVSTLVQDNQETKYVGKISELKAKYRIIPDSFFPTDRIAMVQLMSEMYKNSQNPIFLGEMLRFMDIPNRAELLKKIDIVQQQASMIKQQQQLLENMNIEVQKARRGEVEAGKRLQLKEHDTKQSIQTMKHKTSLEEALVKAEAELKIMLAEKRISIEELELRKQFQKENRLLSA